VWELSWNPFVQPQATATKSNVSMRMRDGNDAITGGLSGILAAVMGDGVVRVFAVPSIGSIRAARKLVDARSSGWVCTDTAVSSSSSSLDPSLDSPSSA